VAFLFTFELTHQSKRITSRKISKKLTTFEVINFYNLKRFFSYFSIVLILCLLFESEICISNIKVGYKADKVYQQKRNYIDSILKIASNRCNMSPILTRKLTLTAQKLSSEINYQLGLSESYRWLGFSYFVQDNYVEALTCYIKSIKINEHNNNLIGLKANYKDLGDLHLRQEEYKLANLDYEKSLHLSHVIKDTIGIAIALNGLGEVYRYKKDYEKSLKKHFEALELFQSQKAEEFMSKTYNYIGASYQAEDNLFKAIDYYSKAVSIDKKYGDFENIAEIYSHIGNMYLALGYYSDSKIFFQQSLEMAHKIGAKKWESDALLGLSNLYQAQNQIGEAYNYLKKYFSVHDSIYNKEKVEKLYRIYTIYETEKKEKENQLLKREKVIEQKELERQIMLNTFFIIALISLLVVGGFLFHFYRRQSSLIKALAHKNKLIQKQNIEISEQSLSLQEANQQILFMNQHLSEIIQQRTQDLEEQNKQLSEYAFINAHQLRSPVATIRGLVQLFNETDMEDSINLVVIKHLKTSAEQLDEVLSMIKNLLNEGYGLKAENDTQRASKKNSTQL
jgi:tetratricopeptide (TPR) repeat protein